MPKLTHLDILKLITGKSDWRVTGVFGEKAEPRTRHHDGTDYGMDVGTVLKAPAEIKVVLEQFGVDKGSDVSFGFDFGNWTMFEAWGYTFLLAHTMFGESDVDAVNTYKKGHVITKSGNTGLTTGPHLHIGVAPGTGYTSLDAFRDAAIDFETLVIDTDEKDPTPPKPKPDPTTTEKVTIPAGSTLTSQNGSKYPKVTSVAHEVNVLNRTGSVIHFSADWLEGVDNAFYDTASNNSMIGRAITIKGGTYLYDDNGNRYTDPTTSDHIVTVESVSGNLLKFSAIWLRGVTSANVKAHDL